jgi:hypothetical protein
MRSGRWVAAALLIGAGVATLLVARPRRVIREVERVSGDVVPARSAPPPKALERRSLERVNEARQRPPSEGDVDAPEPVTPSATLAGVVRDGHGRPVAGIEVRAAMPYDVQEGRVEGDDFETGAATTTDVDGRFALRVLPPGERRLYTTSPGWHLVAPVVTGGSGEVSVTAVSAITLQGVVLDAETRKPVEGTVAVDRVASVVDEATSHKVTWTGFATSTREGRFRCAFPTFPDGVPASHRRTWLRVSPASPEHRDEALELRFDDGGFAREVEILVRRAGFGSLVVEAATPEGVPYPGALDVVLVAGAVDRARRETTPTVVRPGRVRVAVPADRDWDARIAPAIPPETSGISGVVHTHRIRVRADEEVLVQVVLPELGALRVKAPNGAAVRIDPVEARGGGSLGIESDPMPPEGIVTTVTQERWRVGLEGKPETSKEVDVVANAETVVDLR